MTSGEQFILGTIAIITMFLFSLISEVVKKNSNKGSDNSNNSSIDIRDLIYRRYGYRCAECGSTIELHIHHIVPKQYGGLDIESNLILLCKECHETLHNYSFGDISKYKHRSSMHYSVKSEIIRKALLENKRLYIKYVTKDFNTTKIESTQRVITPIELYNDDNRIYLKAYCHLRNGERNFRISRIKEIKIYEAEP